MKEYKCKLIRKQCIDRFEESRHLQQKTDISFYVFDNGVSSENKTNTKIHFYCSHGIRIEVKRVIWQEKVILENEGESGS